MIKDNYLDYVDKNKVVDLYNQLNIDLVNDIIERVKSLNAITITSREQIKVLIKRGGSEVFKEALRKTTLLNSDLKKALKELYEEAMKTHLSNYSQEYSYLNKDLKLSASQLTILNSAIRNSNKELKNLTNSIAFATEKAYIDAVDKYFMQVATGVVDYNTAIKEAVLELTDKNVTLRDSAGRNTQLDVAVRRNLSTGLQQCANKINDSIKDELDFDGVETTAHLGARPTHQIWQGRQYAIAHKGKSVRGTFYPSWDTFKDELLDYNCRHTCFYIILGVSSPTYTEKELEEINNKTVMYNGKEIPYYEATQIQRRLERTIRNKKRQIDELESSGLDVSKEKQRLRLQQKKYNSFCSETGLTKQPERTRIFSNNKGLSSSNKYTLENHPKPKFLEKLTDNSKDNINTTLSKYENIIKNDRIENAIVITKEGEVYQCYGNKTNVWPDIDLGDELIDASVTHNHLSEETSYSFSPADINLFDKYNLSKLRGIDNKYIYELDRNANSSLTYPKLDDVIEDNSFYHIQAIDYSIKHNISYKRWKND